MSKHGKLRLTAMALALIAAMLVSACTPPATTAPPSAPTSAPATGNTPAPQATQPPAATTAPTGAPAGTGGKIVTISFTQEPDNLNPMYTTMYFSAILRDFYLVGLWNIDDKGEAVPQIAAEMPSQQNGGISADNLTFTIKLRPDAKWSDGQPLTADDYVFSYQMVVDPKNAVASTYPFKDYVDSVTAKDEHTLVIKFKKVLASWRTSLFAGSSAVTVLPKHVLQAVFEKEGKLDAAEWNRNPVPGIGPYKLKEWQSGAHLIFEKDPNYWGKVNVDQIFVRIVPDDASQINALKAGDADIGVFISPGDVPDLKAGGALDIVTVMSGYDEGWYLNLSKDLGHPALQDVRVRKALAMAIDRDKIANDLLFGVTQPGVTFWDTTPPYADPSIQPIKYDPEGAKALLDEAGWKVGANGIREKDGKPLKLRYVTTTREIRKSVQAVTQQMLKAVGIDVELINEDSNVFFNPYSSGGTTATGQYDISEYSNSGLFPDPDTSQWLCSEIPSKDNPEGSNWNYYCNEDLDKLFKQQATETDPQKRIQIFSQIEKIMADEVVWINLWRDPDIWALNKRLSGIKMSGATPFWNAYEWDAK